MSSSNQRSTGICTQVIMCVMMDSSSDDSVEGEDEERVEDEEEGLEDDATRENIMSTMDCAANLCSNSSQRDK